jgi:AraC-like DNA-binding protein
VTVIPVLHRNAELRTAIRRGAPRSVKVMACRTILRLQDTLQRELVDAVVVDVRGVDKESVFTLVRVYPGIPFFAFSRVRADDGSLVATCRSVGFRDVLVEGVDDGAAGELITGRSATRRRLDELADAPRLLRLTEPLQLQAWHEVVARVGTPTQTRDIAAAVRRTREHLSREFAAGGAPNLKRVIDLVHAAWAADLLANPAYNVRTVARILGFSTPGHLAGSAKRVAGVTPAQLAELGPGGVLRRFRRGRTRSRL